MNLICRLLVIFIICSMIIEASSARKGKITGAYEARPNSNPYVVSLVVRYHWKRYRHCTGSILSERWILSSGRCVTDSSAKWYAMDAIVGAHNLETVTSSMVYPISDRMAHPMYRGGVGPYDISMMKTSRNIKFSEEVQPIKLPVSAPRYNMDEDLLITGWGAIKRSFFTTVIPNKLRQADVTYLPFNECYRAIDRIKNSYEANPLRRYHNLCTGLTTGGIRGGCTGDSGGPLVQYVPVPNATEIATDREDTTTAMASSTTAGSISSPIPMTTDSTSTTSGSTTPRSTISPIAASTSAAATTAETTTATSTTSSTPASSTANSRSSFTNSPALRDQMMPTVVGVISWGVVPCGISGSPAVYSNVTNYLDFINAYLHS